MYPDKFGYTLRQEMVKLNTISKTSVLAKNIVTRSLMPILNDLDEIYGHAMHKIGREWTVKLKAKMVANHPHGKTYRIIEVDESAPVALPGQRSQRYKPAGEWQASAPGEPPARLTSTLMDTIGYRVQGGVLLIGQLIGPSGDGDLVGTEIRPLFFKGVNKKDLKEGYAGRLFISDDADQTPVREYSTYLDQGFAPWHPDAVTKKVKRPWFGVNMIAMREALREALREEIWAAIRKRTRSTQIQKALIVRIYMTQR